MTYIPPQPTVSNGSVVLGQTLSVSSSVKSFAAFNSDSNLLVVQVNGNNAIVTFDGTTPGSSNGATLYANQSYTWDIQTAERAKFVQQSATSFIFGQEFITSFDSSQLPDVDLLKTAPLTTSGSSGTGNVTGPSSSTAGDIATFADSTGKLIQDGGPASLTIAGTLVSLGGSISQDTITGLGSTGLVKRTGSNALAIASSGTDYASVPVAIIQGGTGATSATAAFKALSPLTTLGDTLYENNTPTPTRLAGNTGSRTQYYAQTGTGSVSAAPAWTNGPSYNVEDYGVVTGDTVDQSTAINAMIATLPSNATVYFPGNFYRVDSAIGNTVSGAVQGSLTFIGSGVKGTILKTHSLTHAVFALSGADCSIQNLTVQTSTRTGAASGSAVGNPIITIGATFQVFLNNLYIAGQGDGLAIGTAPGNVAAVNFLVASNVQVELTSVAGIALTLYSCGGTISNFVSRQADGKPAVYMQGTATSMVINNSLFAGGGPLYSYTPSAITSNGTTVTVSLSNTTGFYVGSYIVLDSMTTTSYIGCFRITTVTANTSVACVATPFFAVPSNGTGTVGGGTAKTIPTQVHVDNLTGSVNESNFDNCQFVANSYPTYKLSTCLLFDGTKAGAANAIEGWSFSNNYCDWGTNGYIFIGGGTAGSSLTTSRASIVGGTYVANNGISYIWAVKSPGISVCAPSGSANNPTSGVNSSYYYVRSDGSFTSDGFRISCGPSGPEFYNNFNYSTTVFAYGLTVDGAINIITVVGVTLWGQTAPFRNLNTGITSSTLLGSGGCQFFSGTSNPPTKAYVAYFSPLNGNVGGVVRLTTSQSISDTTETNVSWSSADYDDASVWDSSGKQLFNVPTGTIRMALTVAGQWDANATGGRIVKIKDQSANTWARSAYAANPLAGQPSGGVVDTLELDVATLGITSFIVTVEQNSGGALNFRGGASGGAAVSYRILA